MDRGIWITWYDLPAARTDEYLAWAHETYIPALLGRPGYLWAAHYAALEEGTAGRRQGGRINTDDPTVPKGTRFALIVGAADSIVLGDPPPSVINAEMPTKDRNMLALRIGERTNVMAEASRVDGPEAKHYKDGMAPPPAIQFGSFICNWQDEEDMLRWYAQSRLPAMAKLPGCIRARKLASVAGWAKHAVFYEFVSMDARNHFLQVVENSEEDRVWGQKVVRTLTHSPGSSTIAQRIWPPVE